MTDLAVSVVQPRDQIGVEEGWLRNDGLADEGIGVFSSSSTPSDQCWHRLDCRRASGGVCHE